MYSLRTVILPFLFIFDTELLLIGVDSFAFGAWVFIKATIAILLFSAAMQGYMFVRSKWYESVILLTVSFMLFAPQFWINLLVPSFVEKEVSQLEAVLMEQQAGDMIKMQVNGMSFEGKENDFEVYMQIAEGANGTERLSKYGLMLKEEEGKLLVDDITFNSAAEKAFGDDFYDYEYAITTVEVSQEQPSKRWMNIPAVLLFLVVVLLQISRRKKSAPALANA